MVIGKISSLATTIIVFALAFIFLKQAYGSSIGSAGVDVGMGLTSTASGISSVISAFITPITSIFGTVSSLFTSLGGNTNSDGARAQPSNSGRDERNNNSRVRTGDTSTISWSSGASATVPALSQSAKSFYSGLGVSVN